MTRLGLLFDRNNYQEIRRRITRGTLQSLLGTSEARLQSTQDLSQKKIRRILICRPNHRLGNLVLLTPLIIDTQRLFPDAEIDIVLAGDQGPELFRAFGNVKHIHVLHRRMVRHPIAVVRTAMQIRRTRYDLAIDPCETSQSSRFLMAIAKAKYAIGLPRKHPEETATRPIPKHMAKWPVALLRRALSRQPMAEPELDYPSLDIRLSPTERRSAALCLSTLIRSEELSRTKIIVGVFADATGTKRHEESWWICFLAELRKHLGDCAMVEIAPPDGRSRLSSTFPAFSSTSARKVAALISNMTCFISADCGVMHLASASGVPTIGLFSVTDSSKYEPYGNGSQAIQTSGKSPEEVAQLASTIIERIRLRGIPERIGLDRLEQASPGSPS